MDKITEAQLDEFSNENALKALPQNARFEHYVSYVTVQNLYGETFDTGDIVLGGDELGLDGIAIIVNGALVPDLDSFNAIADSTTSLDVVFIFIQADRSHSFDTSKIGNIVFAIRDFFADLPKLPRTSRLKELAEIAVEIYKQSAKFKRSNPSCYLYYATTGQWIAENTLDARRKAAIAELESENIFGPVLFECIGADVLQKLYRQAKNAVARDFTFSDHAAAPEIPGVKEAYLGYIPAKEFLPIITSEDGEIMRGIFESNLRDFQGPNNPVNNAIKETLASGHRARFVLMNNGVTIIARVLQRTAHKFHIEDFQIVNGCQTSNVLFDFEGDIDDVMVPLRLISSNDDDVIQSIVTATNQQTQLSREQLFAATEFPKKLEQFFQAHEPTNRIYYERRSRQYDRLSIEKVRVITQANTIRAFAGMFLEEPHRTTRNFNALLDNVEKTIFVDGHKLDPYYVAAFTLYKLEKIFRAQKLSSEYKATRYQILLAARRLANPDPLPRMNSNDMEKYCKVITDSLWDAESADALLQSAANIVSIVAKGHLDRDNIRTVAITDAIKNYKVVD
jgi:AIPR protein